MLIKRPINLLVLLNFSTFLLFFPLSDAAAGKANISPMPAADEAPIPPSTQETIRPDRVLLASAGSTESPIPPSIQDTIWPDTWLTVGLFPSGARESSTDPLHEHGGFSGINPEAGMEHHSFLGSHGKVSWTQTTMEEPGTIRIDHPESEPTWEDWRNYKGRTFTRGSNYAWTTVEVEERARALVQAGSISSFRINDQKYAGDFYNNGHLKIPVILEAGTNEILLKISGSPNSRASFSFVPVENDIQAITENITAPHLVRGHDHGNLHLGLPLANHTNQWKEGVEVEIFYTDPEGNRQKISEKQLPPIGPMAFQQSAHRLDMTTLQWDELNDEENLSLEILVRDGNQELSFQSRLEIKEQDEPFNVTFLDSDNSVQFYSAFPPANMDPDRSYPAIFSLHGASVDATGPNGYTQKDWCWVIAPTNRGRYGFDWEKQGKVNALNSLSHAITTFGLDPSRIYLSGHSMGGHGSWVLSTSHPHLFAAVAPSAGWTSFDIYTPFVSRMDHLAGSPANLQLLYSVLQPTRTLSMVENLHNTPVYILHGGDDKSVPPDHPRMFYQRLSQLGYEVTYNEVPGMGHWWSFDDTDGADCVNHADLMDFFRGKQKDPAAINHIRFRTAALAESHQAYWISVLQRNNFVDDTRIRADVETRGAGYTVRIETSNVRRLEIHLDEAPFDIGNTTLWLNGQEIVLRDRESMVFDLEAFGIHPGESIPEHIKHPGQAGTIKQVFYEPFALVYSTLGGDEWESQTYGQARELAQSWYYRGNGRTLIVPDTLVDAKIEENYNLILFGSPATNAYYGEVNDVLPITVYPDSIVMGSLHRREAFATGHHREVYTKDLAVKFIHPNPRNPERLIQINGGATLSSQALSVKPAMISSADGLPDYLLFDDRILETGFAALIHAGFFNNFWRYDPDHAIIQTKW
ncbi:MAG: prolyl oligopeptidase family serine peptidase [Bacteroidales bacterium]